MKDLIPGICNSELAKTGSPLALLSPGGGPSSEGGIEVQHGKTQIRQFPTVWGCKTGRGYICLRDAPEGFTEEVPFRLGMLEEALFSHLPKGTN